MNPPAQTHHFALRRKLSALCDSPMAGEATSAQKKLARLEERFDFSKEPESVDLFNPAGVQVVAGDASQLFEFDPSEQDVASLVQWALENRYHLNTALRHRDWKTSLWIDAAPECLPALRTLCATIRSQFVTLWEKLASTAEVLPGDRRSFLRGLYDGMLQDERKTGEMMPARHVPKRKKVRTKKAAVALRPGLSIHPYELALSLGRKIRVCESIDEIGATLENSISGHLENRKGVAA